MLVLIVKYMVNDQLSMITNQQIRHLAETIKMPEKVGTLEKLIVRFPDIVERATAEHALQDVANYLINLAGSLSIVSMQEILLWKRRNHCRHIAWR